MSSDGDLDPRTVHILDTFTNCIMINFLGVFGIVGNSINIAVLSRHGFRESTNIVLIALSTSDLLFSTFQPITRLKCIVGYFDSSFAETVHAFVTVYFFLPKFVCLGISFWYVALIAIERFVAVYFPFQVSKIFTRKRMLVLVIFIFCFGFTMISPTFFAFQYHWRWNLVLNISLGAVDYTDFYITNHEFLDFYMWVGLNNLFCTLSFSVVLFCCLAICLKLMRSAVKREKLTTTSSGYDVKVVKMLVTVCTIYIFVAIPTITLYSYYKPSFIFVSPVHRLMNDVSDILFLTNASSNFIVYVSMSKKFADTYKQLLGLRPHVKMHRGKTVNYRTNRL
ncbi:FMRFamide peptide receptor frpr-18-like [Physella acuta]|uniref:FMRFamide peptide receptor frpr-18-like n=1 Tax=Physella acuta TaxID=109671 RepID=UPI0027DD14B2|nr:FMRFamide peptide receptor frpr-18-like [Physella acuta]